MKEETKKSPKNDEKIIESKEKQQLETEIDELV